MAWVLVWYSLIGGDKPVAIAFPDETSCHEVALIMKADETVRAFCFRAGCGGPRTHVYRAGAATVFRTKN
jgi:hypothetical protein